MHVSSHTNTSIITTHTEQLEDDSSVNVTLKRRIIKATKQVICKCLEWYACLFVEKRWHRWRQRVCLLRSYCNRLSVTTTTATIDRWFCNWLWLSRLLCLFSSLSLSLSSSFVALTFAGHYEIFECRRDTSTSPLVNESRPTFNYRILIVSVATISYLKYLRYLALYFVVYCVIICLTKWYWNSVHWSYWRSFALCCGLWLRIELTARITMHSHKTIGLPFRRLHGEGQQ